MKKIFYADLFLPFVIFFINIFIQNYNLGKLVQTFTDEGVYLYSTKLLTDGLLPYKDFFLGQPFYVLITPALLLVVSNFDINFFHFFYTLWFFSTIFPLYFVIVKLTNSRLAAVSALILFSTYQELVQWGAHQLDLRQASLPFLTLSLFFIYVKPKQKVAALMLALFAICIVTNLALSLILIGTILLGKLIFEHQRPWTLLKENGQFLTVFSLLTTFFYLILFLIPNSINNIVFYQLNRPFLSYGTRWEWFWNQIINNWPIYLFGLAGSLISNRQIRFLGIFNLISLILLVLIGSNFYQHYLTILAVTLAISAAVLISYLNSLHLRLAVILLIILGIYQSSFNNLKYQLIEKTTPDFFQAVKILKNLPGPLFTFEPIYGLYAGKNLTYFYNFADMRYFRVMGTNLSEPEYKEIVNRSNTVLIEPFAKSFIPQNIKEYIQLNMTLVYQDTNQQIYTKR